MKFPEPGGPVPPIHDGLRRRLTHDWAAKLLALLAASLLWFFASEDRRAIIQQSYDVPVNVRDNTGDGAETTRAVAGLSPSTIKVTLSGRPERLRELRGEMIEAVVNVTDISEGSFNQPVTVKAPDDTEVVQVTPDRVQGLVDSVQTRTLPVTVTVYAPGSAVMPNYQADPAEVTVSGPSRVVNEIEQLIYAPVNLEPGASQPVSVLALDSSGEPVRDVKLTPATVTLTRVDTGELPVRSLPVRLAQPSSALELLSSELTPPEVRVVGPADELTRLSEVIGTVDYRPGTYQTQVQLRLPAGVQALDTVSAQLQVREAEAVAPATASAAATDSP